MGYAPHLHCLQDEGVHPAVEAKLVDLSDSFLAMMGSMHSLELESMEPHPLTVSTITFTGRMSIKQLDLMQVELYISMNEEDDGLKVKTKGRKRKLVTTDAQGNTIEGEYRAFYNQLEISYERKSIKLFKNGSVQVTGCRSHFEFVFTIEHVCSVLNAALDTSARLEHLDIQMIQANFTVGATLDLGSLQAVFMSNGVEYASYEPDVYPGLNVKLVIDERKCTALLFRSGSVTLTGAKDPWTVALAYEKVCKTLDGATAHRTTIPGFIPRAGRSKHQSIRFIEGYPSFMFYLCAK